MFVTLMIGIFENARASECAMLNMKRFNQVGAVSPLATGPAKQRLTSSVTKVVGSARGAAALPNNSSGGARHVADYEVSRQKDGSERHDAMG
jgi:hypothetical protein